MHDARGVTAFNRITGLNPFASLVMHTITQISSEGFLEEQRFSLGELEYNRWKLLIWATLPQVHSVGYGGEPIQLYVSSTICQRSGGKFSSRTN
jgi:hypothetical protein